MQFRIVLALLVSVGLVRASVLPVEELNDLKRVMVAMKGEIENIGSARGAKRRGVIDWCLNSSGFATLPADVEERLHFPKARNWRLYLNNVTKQLECAAVERMIEEALVVEKYAALFETDVIPSSSIVRNGQTQSQVKELLEAVRVEIRPRVCEVGSALDCSYEKCEVHLKFDLPESVTQFINERKGNPGFSDALFSLFLCDLYRCAVNLKTDIESLLKP